MSPYFRAAILSLAALVLLCWGMAASAGSVTLTWVAPTTRTDGSALTGAITYRIYRGTSAANVAASTTPIATVSALTYTDTTAPAGTVFYAATAVDSAGVESAKTAAASVVVPVAPPNPPTGLTGVVQVADTNVYKLRQAVDGFQFVAIGRVPAGTACLGQSIGEYSVVPRSAVTLYTKFDTLPLIAFAKCA